MGITGGKGGRSEKWRAVDGWLLPMMHPRVTQSSGIAALLQRVVSLLVCMKWLLIRAV